MSVYEEDKEGGGVAVSCLLKGMEEVKKEVAIEGGEGGVVVEDDDGYICR